MNDEKTLHKVILATLRLISIMAILIAINSFVQTGIILISQKYCKCNIAVGKTDLNAVSSNFMGQTPLLIVSESNLSAEMQNVNLAPLNRADEVIKTNIEIPAEYTGLDLSAKPYMDYRKITNKNSRQYKLLWSDDVSVDERGFIVDKDGYIAVALGSYFGEIGDRFEITLDTGIVLKVFKVEQKSDLHTCDKNFMGSTSHEVIEFVIDTQKAFMQANIWGNGYVFSGDFNNCLEFKGNVVKIERVRSK